MYVYITPFHVRPWIVAVIGPAQSCVYFEAMTSPQGTGSQHATLACMHACRFQWTPFWFVRGKRNGYSPKGKVIVRPVKPSQEGLCPIEPIGPRDHNVHWTQTIAVDLPLDLECLFEIAHPSLGIEQRHCQPVALQALA